MVQWQARGRRQACSWQRTGLVTQSFRGSTTITGHQSSSSCHCTSLWHLRRPCLLTGRVVSVLHLLPEFMSVRNIVCPITRKPRTHGSIGWPVIECILSCRHKIVPKRRCSWGYGRAIQIGQIVVRVGDVITAKLQAQHL